MERRSTHDAGGRVTRPLVGRAPQQRLLGDVLEDARLGRSSVAVIVGEPGIGKTALLDDLRARAREFIVLHTAGAESERAIPLAGVQRLVAPHARRFDALTTPHREVLRSMATSGEPGTVPAMGLAVLELLAEASDERPVLVVVDDLHWVDPASVEVLAFALRRLEGHRVAVVAATRPGTAMWDLDLVEMELGGLDRRSAHALLSTTGVIAGAVAQRCRDACGGNPLTLLEVGRALTADQRTGVRPLPALLPVGDRLQRWLSERIDGLSERSGRALTMMALAGNTSPALLAEALQRVGLDTADLDEAETVRVITHRDGLFEFAHPLYATIAVHRAEPAVRRASHRALAAASATTPERRAWHLTEGCEGDVRAAVDALREVAERATRQGAHLVAAEGWERLAGLLALPDDRARTLMLAGTAAWDGGRPDLALPLLRAARGLVPPGVVRAQVTDALGQVMGWTGSAGETIRLLTAEVSHVPAEDPVAVQLLVSAARVASLAARPDAVELAERAEQIAIATGNPLLVLTAHTMGTHVRLVAGEGASIAARLVELDDLGGLVDKGIGRPLIELAQLLGFDLMVRERWTQARATFARLIDATRASSLVGMESFALAMSAEVAWRTGRWSHARGEAAADAAFHAQIEPLHGTFGDATLARVEAALGLHDAAEHHARLAIARGDEREMGSLSAWGRHALGFNALAAGRHDEAVEHLGWIWQLERSGGATDPGVLWWHGDLIEALLETRRRDDAVRLVEQLDIQARKTGRTWAAAIAARGRGLLTGDPVALADSVALLVELDAPFEAARSRLALAMLLEGDARRTMLASVLATFEVLGAQPWVERTRAVSAGAVEGPHTPSITAMLSPAELRVALAIRRGLSNREAADALAISTRTVDSHLRTIYRKLGINSRTQLAWRVGDVQS